MAYVRAMCRGADSASVVEDIGGLATAVVAAHEMAHSLGAFHDGAVSYTMLPPLDAGDRITRRKSGDGNETDSNGDGGNQTASTDGESMMCSARHNYLMAPSSSGNELNANFHHAFRLSACSTRAIDEFLR